MNEVTTKTGGKFRKGVCGNPNGRPKGSVNETTKLYAKIKNLASEKYERAFEILWEAVEGKEPWAHQLFFKELVPKKLKEATVFIDNSGDTLDEQITSLRKGLAQFTEHTEESLINALKAIVNIKTNEVTEAQNNIESREALMKKVYALEKVIDYAEGKN